MITILTPTYNRAHTLPRLYQALLNQTKHDFEWLIIDDGSTDNTKKLIENYKKESPFDIRLLQKENGGKHTALNIGFREAKRDWIFIVDSDDWLKKECIEFTTNELKSLSCDYQGFSFLRVYENDKAIGDLNDSNLKTFLERIDSKILGDKADIFKKDSLIDFEFPVYEGENFMAESALYIWHSMNNQVKFTNYNGYVCEYQSDGLSANSIINRYKCVNSTLYVAKLKYTSHKNYSLKIRAGINWWRFKIGNLNSSQSWRPPFIFLPAGTALYLIDRFRSKV